MKIIYSLLLLFSIVNCDLDHEYSHTHSISDGHSTQHSSIIMHSDTGFNIEYLGDSVVKNYIIFNNFENEIENRFVLDGINNNYTIVNYANNIEIHDNKDHKLECLYYSKVVNNLNYTILNYKNVTFHNKLFYINEIYSYCLKKDIHEDNDNNSFLLYPILVISLCVLVMVLIIVSVSCGVMRHRAIAHIHTFTRNPVNAKNEIHIPELEIPQTLEHIHT